MFRAMVGPDPCTGLGSPIAARLAQRIGSGDASLERLRRQLREGQARAKLWLGEACRCDPIHSTPVLDPRAATADPLGCCIIHQPGIADQEVRTTKSKCDRLQDGVTVTHWFPGVCV